MATKLLPVAWRSETATRLAADVEAHRYYLFCGRHVSDLSVPAVYDDVQNSITNPYRDMIFGKRVTSDDVRMVIRNISWVSGTMYDRYDDSDTVLASKDFYAVVNAGAYYHVWKILDNASGANSTIEPDIADLDASDESYQTSDGYVWKYMYSVTDALKRKFSTEDYFPLGSNTSVQEAAADGALDTILVDDEGEGYDNYVVGAFAAGDLRVNGNAVIYAVGNTRASALSGFYTGCIMYISSGSGAGQYSRVTDYFTNANGNFAVIASEFGTPPTNGSEYEIYPEVIVTGDGGQTTNASARAIVSVSGNTISRVEMLERGAGYTLATANVTANSVVGVVSSASVRPVCGPPGGHGYDPETELYALGSAITVKFSNTESNTVPDTNQFQQVGLIRDPVFSNVVVDLAWVDGTLDSQENAAAISARLLFTGAQTTISNSIVDLSSNVAALSLIARDLIYMVSVDQSLHQLTTVSSIVSNSSIELSVNALWTDSNASVYLAYRHANLVVRDLLTSNQVALDVSGYLAPGDLIVGTSGAAGEVLTTTRNGVLKGFDTFVELYKYTCTPGTGSFQENERVYQGTSLANSTSNGSLFSATTVGGSLDILVSNQVGTFLNASAPTIKGANSGATATVVTRYSPELVHGSGKILYLENMIAVPREADETQTIQLVLTF